MRQLSASVTAAGVAGTMRGEETGTGAATAAAPKGQATGRPNVVLMICDDVGYGDLGCYGSSLPTPHLDAMAAEGTRCMRYNSAHPICSASRAALLTGRYAPRSHTAGAYWPKSPTGMDLEETTLAELFRQRGYKTHAIGKWHLGDAPAYLPTSRGFDSFLGVPASDDMAPLAMIRDTQVLEEDTDRAELTPRYTEEALKVIGESGEEPFFLYMAFSYPHDPARASKNFKGKSGFGDYGDAVHEIDWSVGEVLRALEKKGKARDTIVMFTSDHGPWFQGSAGMTRGRKGTAFEGGVRVPFLIRWPEQIPAGAVCQEWLSSLNVLPTVSEWCGLAAPKLPLDGRSMSDTMRKKQPIAEQTILYFTYPAGRGIPHCIRSGAWKLRVAQNNGEIYTNDHTMGGHNFWLPRPELYHLERDPMESYDVAAQNPEVVQRLLHAMDTMLATFPDDVQQDYAKLKADVASVVTPPGAAPRILTQEQIDKHNWSFETPERMPHVTKQ